MSSINSRPAPFLSPTTRRLEVQAPSSRLLSLPNDIFLEVLSHLDTASLGRVEQVSHRMNALAKCSYQPAYGPGPVHRSTPAFIPASDYRALAVEQLQFHREICEDLEPDEVMPHWPPSEVMAQILDNHYAASDESLGEVTTFALYMLQSSEQRNTSTWFEAVATALMAQGRHEEAETYYARLTVTGEALPARTVLTVARFGGPLSDALLASATQPLLEQAFIGAALRGDVPTLQRLHTRGVALDVLSHYQTAATAAARHGHVQVLQFLHDNQVDVLAAPVLVHNSTSLPQESALWEAAKYGQVAAAQFLLGLGGQPGQAGPGNMSSAPVDIAVRLGEVGILRLFAQHTPGILGTHKANGELCLKDVMTRFGSTTQKRIEVLNFLVNEQGVDINAVGPTGRAAIHEAAGSGNVNLMAAVVAVGANVHALDNAGQSAFERALGDEDGAAVATWLAAHMGVATNGLTEQKVADAKLILASQRSVRMQQLATGDFANRFEGTTVEEKIATAEAKWITMGMEDELSTIWARAYSAAALRGYAEQMLGTPLQAISLRADSVAVAAVQSGTPQIFLSGNAQANLPMARKLAIYMFPASARVTWLLEKMAVAMADAISGDELRALEGYHNSDIGRMFAAGTKAKSTDELMAMLKFVG